MRTSDMVKSKFFGARDVQGQRPLVVTIAHVTEELLGRGGKQEVQCFLWFTDHPKGLKLNKTRVLVLEAAFGPDSEAWTGKRVRLSFDPTVKFGNVQVGSIRVETPPGVRFEAAAAQGSWGGAPAGPAAPPGAPPPPVWDAAAGVWRTPAPIAAPAASAAVPPPPVWNAVTGQWEVVNPGTGEVAPPRAAAGAQDATWGGAPTLSSRMAAPADQGWDSVAAGEDPEFGHPDIPF